MLLSAAFHWQLKLRFDILREKQVLATRYGSTGPVEPDYREHLKVAPIWSAMIRPLLCCSLQCVPSSSRSARSDALLGKKAPKIAFFRPILIQHFLRSVSQGRFQRRLSMPISQSAEYVAVSSRVAIFFVLFLTLSLSLSVPPSSPALSVCC